MKRNSKLSLALHALGHMVLAPDRSFRSEDIADHNNTNAVVVRRVLGHLRRAGLVISARGHAGGWRLARPADRITVADVYSAIGEPFFAGSEAKWDESNPCRIEKTLHTVMDEALADAEQQLMARLGAITIAEIATSMHAAERQDAAF